MSHDNDWCDILDDVGYLVVLLGIRDLTLAGSKLDPKSTIFQNSSKE
jgi:hypothetical protein